MEKCRLKKSEHISKIIIHPKNSDILWVSSQGPFYGIKEEKEAFINP